jgi:UDPglucose 6-dehydrogenase
VLLGKRVNTRRVLDGRNSLDPARWTDAGWEYRCLGRPRAGG